MSDVLRELTEAGVSVWLDDISRDRLRRDAELPVQGLLVGRRAIVVDPHRLAGVSHESLPWLGNPRLDRHARAHRPREHVLLIGRVLLLEPFHAGQRHNPRGDPVGRQDLPRGGGQVQYRDGALLTAGREKKQRKEPRL